MRSFSEGQQGSFFVVVSSLSSLVAYDDDDDVAYDDDKKQITILLRWVVEQYYTGCAPNKIEWNGTKHKRWLPSKSTCWSMIHV